MSQRLFAAITLVFALLAWPLALAAEDILIADFEAKDYGDWKVTGEAFGPGPARGTLPGQMHVSGFEGKGLVNTFHKGDGTTGTLTSPPFAIERPFINFLIGGGGHAGTHVDLLVAGKAVRTARGPNTRSGGSEELDWMSWDVKELAGKQAVIQIVDKGTGGWGHINVDQIAQSDKKRMAVRGPASREVLMTKRYLHLPVKNGAKRVRMKVTVGEKIVDDFDIELADAEPSFWVFLDMEPYKGKTATLEVGRIREGSKGLAAITQDDDVPDAAGLYKEKHRPQFHFSSRRGWNNDPNGMVFYKGEWHLYYQHNPYGWKWGNMHWGHAVSKDLVHWTELPIAIYPFRHGDWVFSGSAAVDWNNTGGWQTGDEKVIVAAYTSTGRGEAIAYSNDRGHTFTDYEGNPVVKHGGRDPKIIWYAPGKHWVMAVFDERQKSKGVAFYTSPDLKKWTYESRIDGYFECPEIFELPVDGDKKNTKWVVYGADGAYATGSFDGKAFTPDGPKIRFNLGNCFYASQTFTDVPPEDGRRIQIAWGRVGHPTMPFNQMMDFPVELTLRTTDEGIRMFAEPVREIALLHRKKHAWQKVALEDGGDNPLKDAQGNLFHIVAEIAPGDAAQVGFNLRGTAVVYDAKKQELECRGRRAPLKLADGNIRLEILVDRTSVEIFGNQGRAYMPIGVIPPDGSRGIAAFARGGTATAARLVVHELKSAWQK
ncbi:MAG: GH32 C-terminal domain-containing protein [Candidatus Brocadiae bacterium]|nr:GH32 C-terminal domain-containing protein [Candidatus Brocadiia bacterium]